MSPVKKIGGLIEVNAQGFFKNPCAAELMEEPWTEINERVLAQLQHDFGSNLHSLYLRGSIPKGEAVLGLSDWDGVVVLTEEVTPQQQEALSKLAKQIKKDYPFLPHVELDGIAQKPLLSHPGYLSYRFILKHLSLCLFGKNLQNQISAFKPERAIGRALYGNFTEILTHVIKRMEQVEDPQEIETGCRFIMKRLLRTGMGLVIEPSRSFTRDLYYCWQVFAEYYPSQSESMHQALVWAVDPIHDKKTLLEYLKGFGGWLSEESRRCFFG